MDLPHAPFGPFIRLLLTDRRGAIALTFALLLVPLVFSMGAALDLGRAYYAKNRLAHTLDLAALAVGSTVGTDGELETTAENFFNANYPTGGTGEPYGLSVVVDGDQITLSANADVETTFMKVFGVDVLTVSGESEVLRSIKGLEVALVLDNTGSMTTSNNIGALRTAADNLVDILFGSYDVHPKLYVSVVPYAASVNPGTEAESLITTGQTVSANVATDKFGWKGCVVERTGANTLADTPAATAAWSVFAWAPAVDNNYTVGNSNSVRYGDSYGNGGTGPNLGCPSAITPLTNDKQTVVDAIAALRAWSRGGTLSDIGMAWGRRVLSPEAPFTEGRAWDEPEWDKAVVLMTDGDNQFFKLGSTSSPNTVNSGVVSDFTGYGRLDQYGIVGSTNTNTARTWINNNLSTVCEELKDLGVIIYTVTFTSNINTTTKNIYKNCASDTTKWFDSPTQADLEDNFEAIAIELSKLRVSR